MLWQGSLTYGAIGHPAVFPNLLHTSYPPPTASTWLAHPTARGLSRRTLCVADGDALPSPSRTKPGGGRSPARANLWTYFVTLVNTVDRMLKIYPQPRKLWAS